MLLLLLERGRIRGINLIDYLIIYWDREDIFFEYIIFGYFINFDYVDDGRVCIWFYLLLEGFVVL